MTVFEICNQRMHFTWIIHAWVEQAFQACRKASIRVPRGGPDWARHGGRIPALPVEAGHHELEIPFNAPLPPGEYFVNVDVVAEISSLYRIHRQRLVSEKLQVVQGPCAGAVKEARSCLV